MARHGRRPQGDEDVITIGCVLLHRLQDRRLPETRYSLGKYGVWCNVMALIYRVPIVLFTFFPGAPNPTAATMNWAIGLVGGIVLLATIYYVAWGRKSYTPPDETVDDYIERSAANDLSEKDVGSAAGEDRVLADEKIPDDEPVVVAPVEKE
jgi:hypothetical protein